MGLQERSDARSPADTPDPLGARIKSFRRAKHLTLSQLAVRVGVTEGFLSQVERGLASPSIGTLRRIAAGLGQSIGSLFQAEDEGSQGVLVRRDDRRIVDYPGLNARDEFVTGALGGRLQVIMSFVGPGGGTGDEPYAHDSDEECVLVLEGSLDVWIGGTHFRLGEGDSLTYSSRTPHWNKNTSEDPARVLFILTPPSY